MRLKKLRNYKIFKNLEIYRGFNYNKFVRSEVKIMDATKITPRDEVIYHFFDGQNVVHIGGFYKNTLKPSPNKAKPMPFCEFEDTCKDVIEDSNGVHYVKNGLRIFPLLEGLPKPVYNDDFGKQKYDVKPNILEKRKLKVYRELFIKFYSQGLTKSEIKKAIKLKNDIQISRSLKIKTEREREM